VKRRLAKKNRYSFTEPLLREENSDLYAEKLAVGKPLKILEKCGNKLKASIGRKGSS